MESDSTLAPGARLRQYRIDSILGQGGFGITYLATDEDLQRKVAIKECFPRDFVGRSGTSVVPTTSNTKNFDWALSKFLDEATTLAKFKHDGIVQVLQIIKDENSTAYMVLEFLDGQPLDKWLRSLPAAPSQKQLQEILRPVLSALEVVHHNNYTHRDIAPDNIYVRKNGQSVLLDFGAAKLSLGHQSKTLNLVVKEGYSPPEQYYAEGRSGPWTDIYALSATIYRSIMGKPPVDSMARLDAVQNEEPDPLPKLVSLDLQGYSQNFLTAVDEGLSPQLKARPKDVGEWGKRLLSDKAGATSSSAASPASETRTDTSKPIAGAGKTTGTKSGTTPRRGADGRKNRIPVGIVTAVVVVASAGAGAYYFVKNQEVKRQQQEITREAIAWEAALDDGTRAKLSDYISAWPAGTHMQEAKAELALFGQNWAKSFGVINGDSAKGIAATDDGNIWAVATKKANGTQASQGQLIKLSATGRKIRALSVSGDQATGLNAIAALPDNGVVVAGYGTNAQSGDLDTFVARYSSIGERVWSRTFGHSGNQNANAVAMTHDGGFVVAGSTVRSSDGTLDGWIARLNAQGEMLWDKALGNLWNDDLMSVAMTSSGAIVAVGNSEPDEGSPSNFWLLKLSANGEVLLDRKLGGAKIDRFNALFARSDDSVVLVGNTASFGTQSTDVIFTLLTVDNKLPPKVLPDTGDQFATSVAGLPSGMFFAGGVKRADGSSETDGWLMKMDIDARTPLWERTYGGPGNQAINAITLTKDGAVIIAGQTSGATGGSGRLWVARDDSD